MTKCYQCQGKGRLTEPNRLCDTCHGVGFAMGKAIVPKVDEGELRKRTGLHLVTVNESEEWIRQAVDVVRQVASSSQTFTADDIRDQAERSGLKKPHHPNVWGAVLVRAQKTKVCEMTERTKLSRRAQAHKRRVPVWKSLIWKSPEYKARCGSCGEFVEADCLTVYPPKFQFRCSCGRVSLSSMWTNIAAKDFERSN